MNNHKALKRFGQNYLVDKNIVRKIINEFQPKPSDNIVEIGPGLGILTEALLDSNPGITAVEIDKRVIDQLSTKFPSIKIINQDFLKTNIKELTSKPGERLRIIGNIPYNITSPILFKLIDSKDIIHDALFMVQYEVAKRMTSSIGSKDYGILAVILNYFADVKFCFKVPPTVFKPKPKVNSAVVKINFKNTPPGIDDRLFINVVKASFGNRRKNLKNSLSNSIFKDYDSSESGINLTKRAEQLTISEFINLTKFFQKKLK